MPTFPSVTITLRKQLFSALLSVCCALMGCSSAPHSIEGQTIVSEKTGIQLGFSPITGFDGPDKTTYPSYESWTFNRGDDNTPDFTFLEICVMHVTPSEARKLTLSWRNETDATVEAGMRAQYVDPQVKTIDYLTLDGQTVPIRTGHNVPQDEAWAAIIVGNTQMTFSIVSNSKMALAHDTPTFLRFLHSLRILHPGY